MTSHERHVDTNHWSFHCLFNSLCRPTSKKHQILHCWPFVRGIHRWPVNSPHKGPVMRKKLPFDMLIEILPSYCSAVCDIMLYWDCIKMAPDCTKQCQYNIINFLPNTQNGHPAAQPKLWSRFHYWRGIQLNWLSLWFDYWCSCVLLLPHNWI